MKRILKVLCTFFLCLCSMLVMNISVFASGNDGDAIELDDDYYEKMIQKNNTEHYKLHAEFLENEGISDNDSLFETTNDSTYEDDMYYISANDLSNMIYDDFFSKYGKKNFLIQSQYLVEKAPDLSALANAYTVTCQDKKYIKDGVTYQYRVIYVVDNKGCGGLIKNCEFNAVKAGVSSSVIRSALKFVFENGVSSLAGMITGTPLYSWTLGAMFSVLDGVDSGNVIACSKDSLYRIFVSSQTMMRYTYILDGNSWKLIESSGYAHYIQTNVFVGTISGKITHQTVTNEWSNNTCKDPKYAVESYLTYRGVYPNYRTVNRLGRIKLKGISSTMSFEPVFYELPGYIV